MKTIEEFLAVAQDVCDKHMEAHFPNNPRAVLSIDPKGRKYAKIVREDEGGGGGSVHCFVEIATGNILKAASWKAPAKHARGNINDEDGGRSALGPYGAVYLR
jgi:hypothetical protein